MGIFLKKFDCKIKSIIPAVIIMFLQKNIQNQQINSGNRGGYFYSLIHQYNLFVLLQQ
jgi:hypothetical protein